MYLGNIKQESKIVGAGTIVNSLPFYYTDKAPSPVISNANISYNEDEESIEVEFDLDKGFTLNTYKCLTNDQIIEAYTSLLTNGVDANEYAKQIVNDLILVYYYKDADGAKKELKTSDGNPLVKFKIWNGYLNCIDGDNIVKFAEDKDSYLGQTIPSNKSWITLTSPETGTVNSGWLEGVSKVYVDVIVLYDGKITTTTVSVDIPVVSENSVKNEGLSMDLEVVTEDILEKEITE